VGEVQSEESKGGRNAIGEKCNAIRRMKRGRSAMQSIRKNQKGEKCNQSEESKGGRSVMQSIKRIKRGRRN